MAVTRDITGMYLRPGQVVRDIVTRPASEPRALAYLMGACVVMFIAQWPKLARDAYLTDGDLQMAMGGALLATIFFLPLVFYVLTLLIYGVARALGSTMTSYDARLTLFWALMASSPLLLLNGLTAGFIGPGLELQLVGAAWFGAFLLFWITGLREAGRLAQGETA